MKDSDWKVKPLVVLDIDETLVFGAQLKEGVEVNGFDHKFEVPGSQMRLKMRPNAEKLMNFLSRRFELWFYSNGNAEYVRKVIRYFKDKGTPFDDSRVLSRDSSTYKKKLSKYRLIYPA